jgi:hypothetical protein
VPNATVRANAPASPKSAKPAAPEAERLVVVPKRKASAWIIAADAAAIGLLAWLVMFVAFVAFKVVTHV